MNGTAQRETPQVAIFWLVQATDGEATLLATGCPLDQAEPYGDCLTYGPGHYATWAQWRRDRTVDPALRALVRSYEYEDWPLNSAGRSQPACLNINALGRTSPSQIGSKIVYSWPM